MEGLRAFRVRGVQCIRLIVEETAEVTVKAGSEDEAVRMAARLRDTGWEERTSTYEVTRPPVWTVIDAEG